MTKLELVKQVYKEYISGHESLNNMVQTLFDAVPYENCCTEDTLYLYVEWTGKEYAVKFPEVCASVDCSECTLDNIAKEIFSDYQDRTCYSSYLKYVASIQNGYTYTQPLYGSFTKEMVDLLYDTVVDALKDCDEQVEDVSAEDMMVNHPSHYTGNTECKDAMIQQFGVTEYQSFCLLNAFKYLWRCKHKHETPEEDVRKAAWYLNSWLEVNSNGES